MLYGQPTSWLNWNYRIERDGQTVAELDQLVGSGLPT